MQSMHLGGVHRIEAGGASGCRTHLVDVPYDPLIHPPGDTLPEVRRIELDAPCSLMNMTQLRDCELFAYHEEASGPVLHVVFDACPSMRNHKAGLRSELNPSDVLPRRPQGQLGTRGLTLERTDQVNEHGGQSAVGSSKGA
jgi:hypothetical protein